MNVIRAFERIEGKKHPLVGSLLVEGAGEGHDLGGGPALHGDAQHGPDFESQRAVQLLMLGLRKRTG